VKKTGSITQCKQDLDEQELHFGCGAAQRASWCTWHAELRDGVTMLDAESRSVGDGAGHLRTGRYSKLYREAEQDLEALTSGCLP
jgi:hypothetical protein